MPPVEIPPVAAEFPEREPPPAAAVTGEAYLGRPADAELTQGRWEGEPPETVDEGDDLAGILAPPEAADEIGRLGPYRVLKVLGIGGMGVVFLAEDPVLGRQVALKSLRPEAAAKPTSRQRFLREARATAALRHEHIVTVYHVGVDRGLPFMAMELLRGEPLTARRHRAGDVPAEDVLRIGHEIAEALHHAHAAGLVHRDIKPANVWQEEGGRVKVLDFGLARTALDDTQLTRTGTIVGTPAFMAPEQARGKDIDHRCDLFGLGAVLYWLCTGNPPFKGADTLAILSALALEDPEPIYLSNPGLPTGLTNLIDRLLAKRPDDRPPSAAAVVEELRGLRRDQSLGDVLGYGSSAEFHLDTSPAASAGDPAVDDEVVSDLDLVGEDDPAGPPLLDRDHLDRLVGHALGPYTLEAVLGRGHHGLVFRARDTEGQPAAVKVFFPGFPHGPQETDRFALAMQIRLGVRHPNLVPVRAAGKVGPYGLIATELIEGHSLADYLGKPAGWEWALRVGRDLGRALQAITDQRLRHGDVTPRNVLVRAADGACLLNDLMVRKGLRHSALHGEVREAKRAALAGFLAPEEVAGGAFVDHLADLYRVGVILYALLTGQPPFRGQYREETFEQVRTVVPRRPRKLDRDIPPELDRLVMRALSKRQEDRPQGPAEFLAELQLVADRYVPGD